MQCRDILYELIFDVIECRNMLEICPSKKSGLFNFILPLLLVKEYAFRNVFLVNTLVLLLDEKCNLELNVYISGMYQNLSHTFLI